MKLSSLINTPNSKTTDLELAGLTLDSRLVKPGYAFIALKGERHHGLDFAEQAIAKGAVAIIYEPEGAGVLPEGDVAMVAVTGLANKLGDMAARYYGNPSQQLEVIGITGTNGKTTCSQLLAQALHDCAVIGTLGWGDMNDLQPTLNTTPDALSIQQMLAKCVEQGKQAVAMEVSSHGLQQGRVNGVQFTGALFTNFSRDHLDFHGSMDAYLEAKLMLFKQQSLRFAVVNLDDAKAAEVLAAVPAGVKAWTYSSSQAGASAPDSISVANVRYDADGIHFEVCWNTLRATAYTPLLGRFNLDNVLAVLTTLLALGVEFPKAVAKLANLKPICGRMERLGGMHQPTVIVDYAHTPDALQKILEAVHGYQKLWVVFGCGGNRDQGKRPEMRRIAERYADQLIVTDDNPRNEDPEAIVTDIMQGAVADKITVIHDRAAAIQAAILAAGPEDYVVIAGKGHEDYQEINGVKWPFKDQEHVKQVLEAWSQ